MRAVRVDRTSVREGCGWGAWLAAIALLAMGGTAAANECRLADPNSNGEHVDEICWFELGTAGTVLNSGDSQALSFDLPDGSEITLQLDISNGGNISVVQAPAWTGSNFSGNSGFYTLLTPNAAALNSTTNGSANGTVVTLSDIRLFAPNGSEVTDLPFEIVAADAERLNSNPEHIDFGVVSGGSTWTLLEWLGNAPASAVDVGTPSTLDPAIVSQCLGTYVDCIRLKGMTAGSDANAAVLAARRDTASADPFTIMGQIHSGAGQGFAFGVRWGGVRLNKSLPQGRLSDNDQFTYRLENVDGLTINSVTTTGTGAGDHPFISTQAMPGNTVTLIEEMAAGSDFTLNQYERTIACTNANSGSATVLPSGTYDPASPPTVDIADVGDSIECTLTNTPRIADLTLDKSAPASVVGGQSFVYTLLIANQGTHTANDAAFSDQIPAAITGVTAADVSCGSETGGAVCGPLNVDVTGGLVSGVIQSLPAGGSVTVTIAVDAPAQAGSLGNTASVSVDPDDTAGEPLDQRADNSDSTTTTVTAPPIDAQDDGYGPVNGNTGNANVGNALDNDTLGGAGVDIADVNLSVITPASHPGVVLDPATGTVSVAAGTPAGSYTIEYQICDAANPANCDTATITVDVVAPTIDATDDNYGPINGADGNPSAGNVLGNDTLGGSGTDPSEVDITVLTPASDPGVVLDPATGTVSVAPGTPAGDYTIEYRICDTVNPANCDTATVTVNVVASEILAEDDTYGSVNGADGNANLGNVLDNDTLEGVGATTGEVTIAVTSPASDPGVVLDPATGTVSVAPGTPAGTYTIEYEICETANPTNCDPATVTVTVGAPEIVADDDEWGPVSNVTGNPSVGNVLGNDSVNGGGTDPSTVRIVIVNPGMHPGVALDPQTGNVSVAPGTPPGDYTITYRICEIANPSNCDTATVTVKVSGFAATNGCGCGTTKSMPRPDPSLPAE